MSRRKRCETYRALLPIFSCLSVTIVPEKMEITIKRDFTTICIPLCSVTYFKLTYCEGGADGTASGKVVLDITAEEPNVTIKEVLADDLQSCPQEMDAFIFSFLSFWRKAVLDRANSEFSRMTEEPDNSHRQQRLEKMYYLIRKIESDYEKAKNNLQC